MNLGALPAWLHKALFLFTWSPCERNRDTGVVVETQKTCELCFRDLNQVVVPACKRSIPTSQRSPQVLFLHGFMWVGTTAFIGGKPLNCTILLRTSSLEKEILW